MPLFILSVLALAAGTPVPPFPGVATAGAAIPTPIPFSPPPAGITNFATSFADQHPGWIIAIEVLFMIATIGLIALMSVQTTKTEGLSGSIGGRAEAAYKGRLGFEQQITRVTSVTAVTWIALAVIFFAATR